MERLEHKSADVLDDKLMQLAKIFPECLTEMRGADGQLKRAVNFDLLKEILSGAVNDNPEAYDFTWVGKNKARAEAYRRIDKTLRPCVDESVDWDHTKNLYIEGDNLDVLKLLQQSYMGQVKMIYIDPPYNTGRDFIYKSHFMMPEDEYNDGINLFDGDGNKNLVENPESNPRFHSDWCSMIYPRLLLARNLLSDDGVIFISIDDNEQANLKKICDEVFGANNFVECLIWKKRATPPNDKNIGRIHEFILAYAKNIEEISLGLLPRDDKSISRYSNPDNDPRGEWVASDLSANGKGGRIVQSCIYPILNPFNDKEYYPSEGRCWLFNKDKMNRFIKEGRIGFRENTGAPYLKRYLSEVRQGLTLPTILSEFGYSSTSASEIDKLFNKKGIFEYAKPVTLLSTLIKIGCPHSDDVVMDFFSGSGTTGHAVMALNAEDGGRRRFILVQLPDECADNSEAARAGYKNICEIGKERLRRAGKMLKEQSPLTTTDLDVGFRVLKLDESNYNDVFLSVDELTQDKLAALEENIKEGRTSLDLLFGCLIDWRVPLDQPCTSETFEGATIYNYGDGALMACFDKNLSRSTVEHIAKAKPIRAVFRDAGFVSDADKINAGEIFKLYAPGATVKII